MEILETNELLIELFTNYYTLLTDKQVEYFKLYYFEDYSLKEIADIKSISRNAVHDVLKTTISNLNQYELKLKLKEKKHERISLIEEYLETKNIDVLEKLRKMDDYNV